jgi:hypothetical protein
MEDLQSLMACLDDISGKIGDGMYLDMADKLKNIHNKLNGDKPFHEDSFYYSDDDSESESDSDSWSPDWYDEWAQNEECLRSLLNELKVTNRLLTGLKPIQRITRKVKEAAMKHFAVCTPIFDVNVFYINRSVDGVHAEATFENYVRLSDWSNFSPQERKELTSKKFEKKIYQEYKVFENESIVVKKNRLVEVKRNLEREISEKRERQAELRVRHNL